MKITCPDCGDISHKVIYYGLPLRLCKNEECNRVWGFWSFIVDYAPFNGVMMVYKSSYIAALAYWLFGGNNDEEE